MRPQGMLKFQFIQLENWRLFFLKQSNKQIDDPLAVVSCIVW